MKFCQKCGSEILENAAFCGNCGTPVSESDNPPAVIQELGKIDFNIIKKEELKLVEVILENSAFRYESGAMHYMKGKLTLEAKAPSIGNMFKSMITKEKIVKPVIRGTGTVFLQPTFGEYTVLDLKKEEWILDRGAYFASELSIEIGAFTNKAINAIFSGEKWFQTVVSGTGKVIITSAGPLEEITLDNGNLVVDGAFAIARTSGVSLKVTKAAKGIFSSFISGEGIVNTFSGSGKVLIAPVDNYLNTLLNSIYNIRYLVQNMRSK